MGTKMDNYLIDLRNNRDKKANEILKDDLIDKFGLRKSLLKEITLIQNRGRGNIFELLAETAISKTFNIPPQDLDKQKIFDTPYGKRRIDLYHEETGI